MTTLLSDHDCEGQVERIRYSLQKFGYIEWLGIEILSFETAGLLITSTDEEVWQFCQENGYYLLTGNRGTKAKDASLHVVLNRSANEKSLPVITIGNLNRVIKDKTYCNTCAEAIAEIILNVEQYIGTPRLYIP
jgi:hypothetical protein